jgi:hypothetical protein
VAGEARRIEVRLPASDQDHYRSWLKVVSDQQTVEIPIDAEIGARLGQPGESPRTAGGLSSASSGPGGLSAEPVVTAEVPAEPVDESPPPRLDPPSPFPCQIVTTTGHSITLEWASAISDAKRFEVEERRLKFVGEDSVQESWIAHTKTSFQPKNGQIRAELRDLKPSTVYTLRVVPIGSANVRKPPLFQLKVATESKVEPVITPIRGLVFVLVICIGIGIWRRFRSA